MTFSFHPDAEAEFNAAIDYYETVKYALGLDFAHEVFSAISRAVEHPQAWPVLRGKVRRCQIARFPYGILYSQETEGIFVLAVMHLHRDPNYWKDRS